MRIIAGLGNPGSKYQHNRHNVGFMAADAIARRHGFPAFSRKFQAEIAGGTIGGEKVLIVKPQTFMNLSGQAIGEAMRFHKAEPSELIVFYDELDLAPGRVRVKTGGSHGGHNGIKSTDAHCGKDYRRVRIGIGHPGVKGMVTSHVLGDFARSDRDWLDPLLDALADNAELLLKGDDAGFMNKAALAVQDRPSAGRDGAGRPKGQSHIRQARPPARGPDLPQTGPMAAMLKKLFGKT